MRLPPTRIVATPWSPPLYDVHVAKRECERLTPMGSKLSNFLPFFPLTYSQPV